LLPGTTVSWGNLTNRGTGNLTASFSSNVYTVSGINTVNDWRIVRYPTITMATNPPDIWGYASKITYNQGNTKTWNTTVNVIQLDEFSAASDYYYPDALANVITGTPTVVPLTSTPYARDTWSVTITPSLTSVMGTITSSSTLGGTSSFNGSNKVLTITGNTLQVNAHLANISYTSPSGLDQTWLATYSTTNSLDNFTSTQQQLIRSQNSTYLERPNPTYYDFNTVSTIINYPLITDTAGNTQQTYTMTIAGLESNTVTSLSSTGNLGGTSSFNTSTRTLTITGNKAQVNLHLGNVSFQPGIDYDQNFHMQYRLVTPSGNVAGRLQDFYFRSYVSTSNLNLTRDFIVNTADQTIFANSTPQIGETIAGSSYSVSLSSDAGYFGFSNSAVSSPFTVTGSYSYVNSQIAAIKFYPIKDVSGGQVFYWTQSRDGVQKFSTAVGLSSVARTAPIPGAAQYDFTGSTIFYPTYEQANYLNTRILLVGGGGGGGALGVSGGTRAFGGGGGGGVFSNVAVTE
jgi:hypothetical protein